MKNLIHRSVSRIDGKLFFFELNRNGFLIEPINISINWDDEYLFQGRDTLTIFSEHRIVNYKYVCIENITNSFRYTI